MTSVVRNRNFQNWRDVNESPEHKKASELKANLDKLNPRDQQFAVSLILAIQEGRLTANQAPWVDRLLERAKASAAPAEPQQTIELDGIMNMFNSAFSNGAKHPAIVLDNGTVGLRLNVAGDRARFPGSINVTSLGAFDDRDWFGRIHKDGRWEPRRGTQTAVLEALKAFAADPVGVARDHGRRTGACCFCNRLLTDQRSVDAGFGPICADKFGLAWG